MTISGIAINLLARGLSSNFYKGGVFVKLKQVGILAIVLLIAFSFVRSSVVRANDHQTTTFATILGCMDGRGIQPAWNYVITATGAQVADIISEPGIVKILADGPSQGQYSLEWLRYKVSISINNHHSSTVVITAHADCAGNPVEEATQKAQLLRAVEHVRNWFPDIKIMALWIAPTNLGIWRVSVVSSETTTLIRVLRP